MAFTVQSTFHRPKSDVFFKPKFRSMLEQHLPLLRGHPDTKKVTIDADDVYRFEGDFYGLLFQRGISVSKHWLIMRLNHMTHPSHFGRELHHEFRDSQHITLMFPPDMFVDTLKKRFLTKRA